MDAVRGTSDRGKWPARQHRGPSVAVPHRDWLARWKLSVPSVVPGVEVGVIVGVLVGVAVDVVVDVGVFVGVLVGVLVGLAVVVGVPDPPGTSARKEVTVAVPL